MRKSKLNIITKIIKEINIYNNLIKQLKIKKLNKINNELR